MTAVRKTVHTIDGEQLSVYEVTPVTEIDRPYGVVIMHGAGTGNKRHNLSLAVDFATLGHHCVALDFSGHGESSGSLSELSLRRRRDQAAAVVGRTLPEELPLILVGFSMSGQTVADLVDLYGERVEVIVLCAPGIYGRKAWDVAFGSGFTELIRRPESWRDSTALDTYSRYAGRAVLVLPEDDAVIPHEVTELLTAALATKARFSMLWLVGAGHRLGAWLADHPEHRQEVLSESLRPHLSQSPPLEPPELPKKIPSS
jgi:pimeloyl-ACP methyl ester carboxylesterase